MKRGLLILSLFGASVTLSAAADEKHKHETSAARNSATNPGFEKLKSLEGTWVNTDKEGNATDEVVSVIKLTAGGSAVQETLFPGQPQEMVSIYTPDGSAIVMTHYCVLGNQPQMKADAKAVGDKLTFEFVGEQTWIQRRTNICTPRS